MGRITRSLVTAVMVTAVVAGTAGWASGTAQQPVTGPPAGTAEWRAAGLPDPERMDPAGVARFFAGLGPEERERLVREHPTVVGNLDGAPLELRYAANARSVRGGYPGARILAHDSRGRGQTVLVYGDLATAERVAVLVPGSDVDAGRMASLTRKATALREATGGRTAVVAWAGYTTPLGVGLDAASGELAQAGAERLTRFTEGLRAAGVRPEPSVFCHSYGSVVCGLAAHGLKAKDLVVFGSPGMRAENVAELRTPARVWAAKDPTDWIDRVPNVAVAGYGHGADPTAPEFGARPVPAQDADGHDGYFAPGTSSLRAFAAIAEGDVR
ncbi:alpha/beta hydrolase [Streptomyces sp. NRRL F-5727]|uniref:alpha/beta hydrolase n=1 Tax=Streptomyces sp. NRRL F-5727 TaxID=1463871 RepID=UPI0004CBD4F8|nr:alpha/beta hydrolase [Streptomyces sp. NRRL F-5727]